MRFIIFLLLTFTLNANANELELVKLENNYKQLIITAVNNKLEITKKAIDPKYLSLLSSCHLASTTAWPPELRLKMLRTYSQSQNIVEAMSAFEKHLDNLVLSKELSQKTMYEYVDLQSVIYDGCAKHINSDFWRQKFLSNGMIDYYP